MWFSAAEGRHDAIYRSIYNQSLLFPSFLIWLFLAWLCRPSAFGHHHHCGCASAVRVEPSWRLPLPALVFRWAEYQRAGCVEGILYPYFDGNYRFLLLTRKLKRQLCCQGLSPAARATEETGAQRANCCCDATVARFPGWLLRRHIKCKCVLWHKYKPQEAEVLALKRNFHS